LGCDGVEMAAADDDDDDDDDGDGDGDEEVDEANGEERGEAGDSGSDKGTEEEEEGGRTRLKPNESVACLEAPAVDKEEEDEVEDACGVALTLAFFNGPREAERLASDTVLSGTLTS